MSGLTKEDLRSLLYLISLGIVGAVTIGVFFGMGFMGLTDPRRPVAPRADPILPAQAVKEDEFPPRGDKDAVQGSSPVFYVEKVAGSPAPDAPVNQAATTLRSTALEMSLTRPPAITHRKPVSLGRHRYPRTWRYWVAQWRPDASAGPNPGGGFYGPPNVNVGYINPR